MRLFMLVAVVCLSSGCAASARALQWEPGVPTPSFSTPESPDPSAVEAKEVRTSARDYVRTYDRTPRIVRGNCRFCD